MNEQLLGYCKLNIEYRYITHFFSITLRRILQPQKKLTYFFFYKPVSSLFFFHKSIDWPSIRPVTYLRLKCRFVFCLSCVYVILHYSPYSRGPRCARLLRCINIFIIIITIIILVVICKPLWHLMLSIFEMSPLEAMLLIGYAAASISVYLPSTEYACHTDIPATNRVYLSDKWYTGNKPGIPTCCWNRD